MLNLPLPATDALKLADWLELYAIISPDANASYVDLERALKRGGIFSTDQDEVIEQKVQEVVAELERRSIAADRAYPFQLKERSIVLRDRIESFVPYVFCLCLSFFTSDRELDKKPFPRRMFEYLACEAAKNYVGGEVIRFASPRNRREIPSEFDRAIDELCRRIKEGSGFGEERAYGRKDDALDVVAWREFPDQAEGKLLLMGNCATGNNWDSKLDELQPQVFCENWMQEAPVSLHFSIKAFFVPRLLDPTEWQRVSRRAGMIFDRCRIAYWTSVSTDLRSKQQYLDWSKHIILREAG